jgi:hypothetical protein
MRKIISMLLCGAFTAALSLGATAAGPGASGGHSAAGSPPASSQAMENSNGRFATDRDKGLDRAEDRMSAEGRKHEKATAAQKKHKSENSSAGATK